MSNAVIKRGGKFYLGVLNLKIDGDIYYGYTWNEAKPISKLADVKDAASYKTLTAWLKENKHNPNLKKTILKATNSESVYLLDRPLDPTAEEFEDYWWANINKDCIDCEKDCKQSDKVSIICCYKKKPKTK